MENWNEYNIRERNDGYASGIYYNSLKSGNLNKEEMEELFKMNRSIEEINKIVDIVMTDEDVRDALNDRILAQQLENLKMERAHEEGKEEGEKVGEERGERKKSIKIAKEMLKEGFDIEKVARITGLEQDEVIELKESNEN